MRQRIKSKVAALSLLLLSACSSASLWKFDHISSQNHQFASSRLSYQNLAMASPIRLEFLQMNGVIDCVISLTRYEITPSFERGSCITFEIDGERFEEMAAIYQGNMRLHIPEIAAEKLMQAFLSGKSVKISFDDLQEIIDPENFSKYYGKLKGTSIFFENLLEDLLQ